MAQPVPFPMKRSTVAQLKVGEHFRLDVEDVLAALCCYTVLQKNDKNRLVEVQWYGDSAVTRWYSYDEKCFKQGRK